MTGESLNTLQDRLEKLKADFPEIFTEGRIDIEKFKATFTDDIIFNNERYVLNWAGKSDAFKVLQIPTTATLKPQPEESVNFDTTENIFIEGENLEVLKVLQKSYYGKIKCIIIDPPYNTGNDSFIYPDSFKENKTDYEKRIGEKDEEGYLMKEGMFRKNSKDSGHYHSNWLSMMYPRLFLAKNLLREDGVIFVHIDDNEVHNLRMIMNEIFGEENFIDSICWKKKYGGGAKEKYLVSVHEYILVYAKDILSLPEILVEFDLEKARRFYKYKDEKFETLGYYRTHPLEAVKSFDIRENLKFSIIAPDGTEVHPKRQWRWSKERFEEALKKDEVIFTKNRDNEWVLYSKQYLNDESGEQRKTKAQSVLDDIYTQEGTKEIVDIFGDAKIFTFPKPIRLLKKIIEIGGVEDNDIILDFFAGSATSAQAIIELNQEDEKNRKFILAQLPELCDPEGEAYKAGYKTIADISKERIRRAIKKIETEQAEEQKKKEGQINFGDEAESKAIDLGFKAFKLSPSNFKIWRGNEINEENLVQQLDAFTNPVREGSEQENMLYELVLKTGYSLTDKIEKKESFYSIKDNELILAIESINQASVDKIIALQPKKVIALDILFKENDQLKTNTVLQMKDAEVDFKTI